MVLIAYIKVTNFRVSQSQSRLLRITAILKKYLICFQYWDFQKKPSALLNIVH